MTGKKGIVTSDLWAQLRAIPSRPTDEGFRLLLLDAGPACRVFAAVSVPDDRPALIVELPESVLPSLGLLPRGGAFDCFAATIGGLPAGQIGVALVLRSDEFQDLFSHLVNDVRTLAVAASNSSAAAASIRSCVDRWKRFILA